MEVFLEHFGSDFDIDDHVEKDNALLDSTPFLAKNRRQPKQEILTESWKVSLFGVWVDSMLRFK